MGTGKEGRKKGGGGTKELGEGVLRLETSQCPGCFEVCLVSSSKLRVCTVNWRVF